MTEQYVLGKIENLTPNSDFWERFKNYRFEVKPRFQKCQETIEVKVKSIIQQKDGSFIFEFATQEDSDLFLSNYQVNPIRMIFV